MALRPKRLLAVSVWLAAWNLSTPFTSFRRSQWPLLQRRASTSIPETPSGLLEACRNRSWARLEESLDWTRYHLQVIFVEGRESGRSRAAAGLFERIAQEHSCAGALPVEAAILGTASSVRLLPEGVSEQLDLAARWSEREMEAVSDLQGLSHYDVVVCIDPEATATLEAWHEASALPGHIVELGVFGSYLEQRRPESPIKAWVPDWRAKLDPDYDRRQAVAEAPRDDALAVWMTVPEDLAKLVQPRYADVVSCSLAAEDARAEDGGWGGDDDAAVLTYHVAGIVRFLMDSYPLDLHGGPGYCGPP